MTLRKIHFALAVCLMTSLSACAGSLFGGTQCAGRSLGQAYRDPQVLILAKAAVKGGSDAIRSQVQRGADVNHLEDGAVPPLLWAICADNIEGFEALLKAGADPNLAGNGHGKGDGKGHGVKENGSIIRQGWSATVMAAGTGRPDFLRLALRYGGDLNAKRGEEAQDRPLLQAAYHGLFENVKILVAAGADINVHDEFMKDKTAPDYALGVTGRFDIAVWLLEQGYRYNLQGLASSAEVCHVPLDGEQQRWKEKLIGMLREQGAIFPASPIVKRALQERVIPATAVEDLIMGRKSILDFPKRQ